MRRRREKQIQSQILAGHGPALLEAAAEFVELGAEVGEVGFEPLDAIREAGADRHRTLGGCFLGHLNHTGKQVGPARFLEAGLLRQQRHEARSVEIP